MRLDQLTPEDFETLHGQSVTLRRASGPVSLEVKQVRRLPIHALRATPPFAVVLRGPRSSALGQGIHAIEHPRHGTLEVFLVPIGPDASGLCYEVTFN
jgi:hypothetical protein